MTALYGDPAKKVISFWCMGMNQHSPGPGSTIWATDIYLLVGKISTPGNSPSSLSGQPGAFGTMREVGTLTHALLMARLPTLKTGLWRTRSGA